MQALILAAGMGSRLGVNKHKCMISIAGHTLFERATSALKHAGVTRVIVVTGYNADELELQITKQSDGLEVVFVRNDEYLTTNNIWSFYLAKQHLVNDDTILLESDLIFNENLVTSLLKFPFDNVAVVAKLQDWMDGTTVLLKDNYISEIISKKDFCQENYDISYKTVNIYKFSKEFLRNDYLPMMKNFIDTHGKSEYYEIVLKDTIKLPTVKIRAQIVPDEWYEIDTPEDLAIAKKLFIKE